MKRFRIVTSISRVLTLTVAAASVMGVAITGFIQGLMYFGSDITTKLSQINELAVIVPTPCK